MNNQERELWVLNDEYLYTMKKHSGNNMRTFLRVFREEIDTYICQKVNA